MAEDVQEDLGRGVSWVSFRSFEDGSVGFAGAFDSEE